MLWFIVATNLIFKSAHRKRYAILVKVSCIVATRNVNSSRNETKVGCMGTKSLSLSIVA